MKANLLWLLLLLHVLLFLAEGRTEIGVIIDSGSRIGREQKIAMQIAARGFNISSLRFRNYTSRDPGSLLRAGEALVGEDGLQAILVGSDHSEEGALLASLVAVRTPVVSLATRSGGGESSSSPPQFLVRMGGGDRRRQMSCVAAIVRSYNWRKVVAVYQEDGLFGSDSSRELNLLSKALQKNGAEIEHTISLPSSPLSSSTESSTEDEVIRDELGKVIDSVQSRVFIVLRSSLQTSINFFREANRMGLMGRDTAWILTQGVADYLDIFDSSVLHSIEGAIGIKTGHHKEGNHHSLTKRKFKSQFGREFRLNYPDEHYTEPSFHALRAYDGVSMIGQAIARMAGANESSGPELLLKYMWETDFKGLSGQINFKDGGWLQEPLSIVNVVGNGYKRLNFWTSEQARIKNRSTDGELEIGQEGPVTWPGNPEKAPKGWRMPTNAKPMVIGVPGRTAFDKFVKVSEDSGRKKYGGFCIELFNMVLDVLRYTLPHEFVPYNGTYDNLVNHVYNKTFDAVVGDMTILECRSDKVEFTQPFMESGLSMIVPADQERSAWMFMKPFTNEMWLVTGAILIYTMFVIWFFEHRTNPDFNGPLRNQMATALCFTFSTLFFAHRERVYSNLTRVVLVVWLFVVFIITSSYTANLSSMLTVLRLKPSIDIDWLKKNNLTIGCDRNTFVNDYVKGVFEFKPENIQTYDTEYTLEGYFNSKNISAAFLELPYQRVFVNHYCRRFTATAQKSRFGGFGFVFQKGSPIAADVSKAILKLSENGELKKLEERWFAAPKECSVGESDPAESLSLQNFWGLFVITGATSTICLVVFMVHLLKKYTTRREEGQEDSTIWSKTTKLAKYLYKGKDKDVTERGYPSPAPDVEEYWSSSSWVSESPPPPTHDAPGIQAPEIQLTMAEEGTVSRNVAAER